MTPVGQSGKVFVVSAPSGGGKGTILAKVFEQDDGLRAAISATTRESRKGEVDGEHYNFVSEDEFRRWIEEDRFAEWATVHGEYYGTLKSELSEILGSGHDAVLELDVQGMQSISGGRDDVVSIFIVPPSMEVLENRLRERGDMDEAQLGLRLGNAVEEIAASEEYDYTVLNDDLDKAVAEFLAILKTARSTQQT